MYNTSIRIVMKKAFIFIIAAVATIACTKETNIQDKNLVLDGGLLSIEATISPFVDDATKASISIDGDGEITGTFSWSEGDQIAFPVTASGSPTYVALTYNTETKRFEGNLEDGQEVNYSGTIYYPASVVIGPTYSTSFASIDAAKAGFKMTADVPASLSEKVIMTHESALVHVQFTNVPDFADKLVVNEGNATIATIPASEGTVDFYVPITPEDETKTYTFSIKDGNNVIKSVSKTIELAAGKYYNTPSVTIGPIVLIKNNVQAEYNAYHGSSNWGEITGANYQICFYSKDSGGNGYVDWSCDVSNMYSTEISDVTYQYFVYPASAAGENVTIEICNKGNGGYPRSTRTVTLTNGSQFFDFSYGYGLKKSSERFCYAYTEGDNAIQGDHDSGTTLYAWKGEDKPFGDWDTSYSTSTGKTIMWKDGTGEGHIIRFYALNGFGEGYSLIIRSASSGNKIFNDDLSVNGIENINGDFFIGYWKNGGGEGWYQATNPGDFLTKGVYR